MTTTIPPLTIGQVVSIANCVETARVVRRIRRNLYLVNFKGADIEVSRTNILVERNGRWYRR
jgi:hypothetical protein